MSWTCAGCAAVLFCLEFCFLCVEQVAFSLQAFLSPKRKKKKKKNIKNIDFRLQVDLTQIKVKISGALLADLLVKNRGTIQIICNWKNWTVYVIKH